MALTLNDIRAGDSFELTVTEADYPASDGWSCRIVLTNASTVITINSSADGDSHAFSVTPTTSAAWTPGQYGAAFQFLATDQRVTFDVGSITLLPDITSATDTRSHAEKVLAALEATLEGKATSDQQSMSINGRALVRFSPSELLSWRDKYAAIVASERRADRIRQGLGHNGKVMVRF